MAKGRLIVFDGPDGGGKTTQARLAVTYLEETTGRRVVHVREPGGTAIGEEIRRVLLDPAHGEMCAETETLLYLAARLQLVRQVVRPELDRGSIVVCERFIHATVAYQGAHGTVRPEDIWAIWERLKPGVDPDLVIFLDLDPDAGLSRVSGRLDRMEALGIDFHRHVRAGYRGMAEADPDRIVRIDASEDVPSVHARVRATLESRGLSASEDEPGRGTVDAERSSEGGRSS